MPCSGAVGHHVVVEVEDVTTDTTVRRTTVVGRGEDASRQGRQEAADHLGMLDVESRADSGDSAGLASSIGCTATTTTVATSQILTSTRTEMDVSLESALLSDSQAHSAETPVQCHVPDNLSAEPTCAVADVDTEGDALLDASHAPPCATSATTTATRVTDTTVERVTEDGHGGSIRQVLSHTHSEETSVERAVLLGHAVSEESIVRESEVEGGETAAQGRQQPPGLDLFAVEGKKEFFLERVESIIRDDGDSAADDDSVRAFERSSSSINFASPMCQSPYINPHMEHQNEPPSVFSNLIALEGAVGSAHDIAAHDSTSSLNINSSFREDGADADDSSAVFTAALRAASAAAAAQQNQQFDGQAATTTSSSPSGGDAPALGAAAGTSSSSLGDRASDNIISPSAAGVPLGFAPPPPPQRQNNSPYINHTVHHENEGAGPSQGSDGLPRGVSDLVLSDPAVSMEEQQEQEQVEGGPADELCAAEEVEEEQAEDVSAAVPVSGEAHLNDSFASAAVGADPDTPGAVSDALDLGLKYPSPSVDSQCTSEDDDGSGRRDLSAGRGSAPPVFAAAEAFGGLSEEEEEEEDCGAAAFASLPSGGSTHSPYSYAAPQGVVVGDAQGYQQQQQQQQQPMVTHNDPYSFGGADQQQEQQYCGTDMASGEPASQSGDASGMSGAVTVETHTHTESHSVRQYVAQQQQQQPPPPPPPQERMFYPPELAVHPKAAMLCGGVPAVPYTVGPQEDGQDAGEASVRACNTGLCGMFLHKGQFPFDYEQSLHRYCDHVASGWEAHCLERKREAMIGTDPTAGMALISLLIGEAKRREVHYLKKKIELREKRRAQEAQAAQERARSAAFADEKAASARQKGEGNSPSGSSSPDSLGDGGSTTSSSHLDNDAERAADPTAGAQVQEQGTVAESPEVDDAVAYYSRVSDIKDCPEWILELQVDRRWRSISQRSLTEVIYDQQPYDTVKRLANQFIFLEGRQLDNYCVENPCLQIRATQQRSIIDTIQGYGDGSLFLRPDDAKQFLPTASPREAPGIEAAGSSLSQGQSTDPVVC